MSPSLITLVIVATVLLNLYLQPVNSTDDDLEQEFQDIFSDFLLKPRMKKHIRDTSKVHQKLQTRKSNSEEKASEEKVSDKPSLSPLYNCSRYDSDTRLCVNIRQLGTTLTIAVRVGGQKSQVHWYRVFSVRGQHDQKFSFVKITRASAPWNINLGGDDNELRISPITETDFGFNFFLATLDKGSPENVQKDLKGHHQLLMFRIEPIPIDMGTLYHGEEITISVRSHMELPRQSVQYEWSRVNDAFVAAQNLPSNVKLNHDASAIIIKEYRSYEDMLVTCVVYSNKNFTLARRNFFLGKIVPIKPPNLKVGNEFGRIVRKRRFLDDFYATESPSNWNSDHLSNSKRDVVYDEIEETTTTTEADNPVTQPDWTQEGPVVEFSEIPNQFDSEQATTQFTIVEKPDETVLNFFGDSATDRSEQILDSVGDSASATRQHPKRKKLKQQKLQEWIEEANSIVEPPVDSNVKGYSTIRIVTEEKPTFEDRESMLMADCNRDWDCGINAVCVRIEGTQKFCRCKPHFRGNGLFCWFM